MPVPPKPTEPPTPTQLAALSAATWDRESVPLLPPDRAAQATGRGAFQRTRKLAGPTGLLRARLIVALAHLSTRGRGVWGVLMGGGELSEAAWRKRRAKSSAWLGWLLGERLTAAVAVSPRLSQRGRRIRLLDATRLAQIGGVGDDWRAQLSDDRLAGRMTAVVVTDRHTAEGLTPFLVRPGDITVGDGGYGYRRQVATAATAGAAVVRRIAPRPCPVADTAGQPFAVAAWLTRLEQARSGLAEWTGWCGAPGQR
jgi:hypothetical protein